MTLKNPLSRRNFMKSTAMFSTGIIGATAFGSCSEAERPNQKFSALPQFSSKADAVTGIKGLLFSQVGYEMGMPVRIILRMPKKELISQNSRCVLFPTDHQKSYQTEFKYWGDIWGSHWWVAKFDTIQESGEWNIEVQSGGSVVMSDSGLKVGKDVLWNSTIEWSSVDMLERRKHFTKVGAGWQDAGSLWVESPAQSAMIIALTELLEKTPHRFDQKFKDRIFDQLIIGCNYLVMTREKAEKLGFSEGAMSHDLLGHEKDILPHDAMKAVIALVRSQELLPEKFQDKKDSYKKSAEKSFNWLLTKAKPMGEYGYSKFQRGLPENTVIPKDQYPTRDLILMCRSALEMRKLNYPQADELALKYANLVMDRQIKKEHSERGYYGHFFEFAGMPHSEPSWTHGIIGEDFGTDMGGIYPNYLMPLLDMLKLWPDHKDASRWKSTLENFTYGFLIPSCEKNPFYLVPQGIFREEGPVWFCGTFHGTNAIYGFTAALALELEKLFNEPKLKEIAYGNLQWLSGLNAGITAENVKEGCVIFSTDIPQGMALPASMICQIGKRWAGTWFQTRGVICNGFSTGKQFVYDTAPLKANDGPNSLTDEDWIPHSAAWLTGLVRL